MKLNQLEHLKMIDKLIAVLMMIESGGNPNEIGDNGKAVGILQIHKIVIDDVNRIYGTDYRYDDRTDVKHSDSICRLYLAYWGDKYEQEMDMKPSLETYARIWNGGPRGWNKKSTIKYWNKVKEI